MDYTVRELDDGFYDELIELDRLCFPEEPWSPRLIRSAFAWESRVILGITAADALVAFCFGFVQGEELQLVNFGVDPAHRSKHVAKRLLAAALNRGLQLGAKAAIAEARVDNVPSQKLLGVFGFEAHGTSKGFYNKDGSDAIIFRLRFSSIPPYPGEPHR